MARRVLRQWWYNMVLGVAQQDKNVSLDRWRSYVAQRVELLWRRHNTHALRAAFGAWSAHWRDEVSMSNNKVVEVMLQRLEETNLENMRFREEVRQLEGAQAMREAALEEKRQAVIVQRIALLFMRSSTAIVRAVFSGWVEAWKEEKEARRLEEERNVAVTRRVAMLFLRHSTAILTAVFSSWVDVCVEEKETRRLEEERNAAISKRVTMLFMRNSTATVRAVFSGWVTLLYDEKLVRKDAALKEMRQLMEEMYRRLDEMRRLEEINAEQLRLTEEQAAKVAALEEERTAAVTRRVGLLFMRHSTAIVRAAFSGWADVCVEEKETRQLEEAQAEAARKLEEERTATITRRVGLLLMRSSTAIVRAAFNGWVDVLMEVLEARWLEDKRHAVIATKVALLLMRSSTAIGRAAFAGWVDVCGEEKEARRLEEERNAVVTKRVAMLFLRHSTVIVRAAFSGWVTWLYDEKLARKDAALEEMRQQVEEMRQLMEEIYRQLDEKLRLAEEQAAKEAALEEERNAAITRRVGLLFMRRSTARVRAAFTGWADVCLEEKETRRLEEERNAAITKKVALLFMRSSTAIVKAAFSGWLTWLHDEKLAEKDAAFEEIRLMLEAINAEQLRLTEEQAAKVAALEEERTAAVTRRVGLLFMRHSTAIVRAAFSGWADVCVEEKEARRLEEERNAAVTKKVGMLFMRSSTAIVKAVFSGWADVCLEEKETRRLQKERNAAIAQRVAMMFMRSSTAIVKAAFSGWFTWLLDEKLAEKDAAFEEMRQKLDEINAEKLRLADEQAAREVALEEERNAGITRRVGLLFMRSSTAIVRAAFSGWVDVYVEEKEARRLEKEKNVEITKKVVMLFMRKSTAIVRAAFSGWADVSVEEKETRRLEDERHAAITKRVALLFMRSSTAIVKAAFSGWFTWLLDEKLTEKDAAFEEMRLMLEDINAEKLRLAEEQAAREVALEEERNVAITRRVELLFMRSSTAIVRATFSGWVDVYVEEKEARRLDYARNAAITKKVAMLLMRSSTAIVKAAFSGWMEVCVEEMVERQLAEVHAEAARKLEEAQAEASRLLQQERNALASRTEKARVLFLSHIQHRMMQRVLVQWLTLTTRERMLRKDAVSYVRHPPILFSTVFSYLTRHILDCFLMT
jgi:hypothetical protein